MIIDRYAQSKGRLPSFLRFLNRTRYGVNGLTTVVLFTISILLNTAAIEWALPNEARSEFYPTDLVWYEPDKHLGRLYKIAPYEPYNPDESFLLDALSELSPADGDFNPNFFNYPSLSIYLTGVALKVAEAAGYVTIVNSKEFYIAHPEEFARFYVVGRLLAALLSSVGVVALYHTARLLYDRRSIAFLSTFLLAISPLWVRNSHFMLVNVPATSWMILCALLAAISIRHHRSSMLLLSAFLAGLATSTKYTSAAIFVLPLFAVLMFKRTEQKERSARNDLLYKFKYEGVNLLLVACISAATGYLIGTPYTVISSNEFLNDVFYEGTTKLGFPTVQLLVNQFIVAQGTVVFVVSLMGLAFIVWQIKHWQNQFILLFLLAGISQRLISSSEVIRYVIPALPALALAAGTLLDAILRNQIEKKRSWLGSLVVVLVLLTTFGYTLDILLIMRGDDVRTVSAEWITSHVEEGEAIGVYDWLYFDMPPINANNYTISRYVEGWELTQIDTIVRSQQMKQELSELPIGFEKAAHFRQFPTQVWTWPSEYTPHDWTYTFLEIEIYSRD